MPRLLRPKPSSLKPVCDSPRARRPLMLVGPPAERTATCALAAPRLESCARRHCRQPARRSSPRRRWSALHCSQSAAPSFKGRSAVCCGGGGGGGGGEGEDGRGRGRARRSLHFSARPAFAACSACPWEAVLASGIGLHLGWARARACGAGFGAAGGTARRDQRAAGRGGRRRAVSRPAGQRGTG